MSDVESSSDRRARYRFSRPGGVEIETSEMSGDEAAEARAHELSKANTTPIIIRRHESGDDWEYVTEIDDRPSA